MLRAGWYCIALLTMASNSVACLRAAQDNELVVDVLPAPFDDAAAGEESIESLAESHRQLVEQLKDVLKSNEELSQRISSLESKGKSDKGESKSPLVAMSADREALFDSLNMPSLGKSKPWYEKLSIRGYAQIRFGRSVQQDPNGAAPILLGDRSISGTTGTFSVRRARMIVSGDVSEYLTYYFQADFANNPADGTNTLFAQIRDLYGDIYLDTTRINRLRVGQSKIPWGFEEMQSSGNRIPLDRSDAIDSGDNPNQRDLGVFYYWTPVDKQKLLRDLVDGGLKGSGNYGIFAFGVYNGQGGSEIDLNRGLHTVSRLTWPWQLESGQVVETSIQGYYGKFVASGSPIRPLGQGTPVTPAGVDDDGILEERLAASFVWYPQPWGFQSEWNVGRGPGLNANQTSVISRPLSGGYAMTMYKLDTPRHGIFYPYARYQHYLGGYRSISNAPYGTHDEYDVGVEWQIRKELELVVEYGFVNGVSLGATDQPGVAPYQNYTGQLLRCQLQINY